MPRPVLLAGLIACALILAACGDEDDTADGCDVFHDAGCIDTARILADVTRLASAEYRGRAAGTAENEAVVRLVADRFAEHGVAPAGEDYLQGFRYGDWEATAPPALEVAGQPWILGPDYDLLWFSGAGSVEAELVFVGHGFSVPAFDPQAWPDCPFDPETGYDEWDGVDAAGKIAVIALGVPGDDPAVHLCPPDPLCSPPELPCYGSTYRSAKAQDEGVVGMLLFPPPWRDPAPVPFGAVSWRTEVPALLAGRDRLGTAIPDLPDWLEHIATTWTPASRPTGVTARLEVSSRPVTTTASNVLGVVPGSGDQAAEVVVIGAHLDHMGPLPFRDAFFPGADDNASGTAVMLELARVVAASATRPRRTLLFAAWNAEEHGLIGSYVYVREAPVFPIARTVASFSIDMVGAGSPGLDLFGGADHPGLVELARSSARTLGLEHPIAAQPALLASDHAYFELAGVPGLLASTPGDHPTYHSEQDTADRISPDAIEAAARLVWAAIRPLALGEDPEVR